MKALKIFILIFLLASTSFANHVIGYDMCLVNIKNSSGTPTDTYKWVLKIYRDVNGTLIPNSISFQVFSAVNASVGSFTCTKINPQTFLTYSLHDCPPTQAQLAIELGIYESPAINYSSLSNTTGYYVSSGFCCRNTGILNVPAPSSSFGITFTMDFPRLNAGSATRYNSSPEFKKNPLTFFSVGKLYTLNWQVTDPDGDSLVYSLAQPLDDSNPTKPFNLIPYAAGYHLDTNIIDGLPDLQIHPRTGDITFKSTQSGRYLVAFKVDEYRKISGIPTKIGSIRREFQLVTIINPEFPPVLTDHINRTNSIKDTVYVTDSSTYLNNFNAKEQIGDSVFIKINAETGLYQNILNSALFNVKWGMLGGVNYVGSAIKNKILGSRDSIKTSFVWKLDSTDIKRTPYRFQVISFDKTCPVPLEDTLNVELYVLGHCLSSKQISMIGCDSIIDELGRKHYTSKILVDTLLGKIGCDTILTQHITVNHSSSFTLHNEGCDSVLSINGNYYFNTDTIYQYISNAKNCDSVITQILTVFHTPKAHVINGNSTITDISPSYYYGTAMQSSSNYLWTVQNGTIISGQGTNIIEVRWISTAIGRVNCYVFDSLMKCVDSSHLNINKTTGLTDVNSTSIKIYPNPTNNILNIEGLTANETTSIMLYDVQGKIILTSELLEKGSIDLSSLNKGIYVIKVGEVVKRVTKL